MRQESVARSLGVSRAPLREALTRLESEGIVLQLPHKGYTVVSLDPDEIQEIFELRMLIESNAIKHSTRLRAEADIREATRIIEEMEHTPMETSAGHQRWFALNTEFHEALLVPSGRVHHRRVISNLRGVVEPYLRIEGALTGNVEVANREHRQMLDAFAQGDDRLAAKLAREHVTHTLERLITGMVSKMVRKTKDAPGGATG